MQPHSTLSRSPRYSWVAPQIMDCFPPMKAFIDLAIKKGVNRFVALSASPFDFENGPMMGKVSRYIVSVNDEYAIFEANLVYG